MPNDTSADWDETAPVGTDFINKGDDEIRVLRKGVRERDAKEHVSNASAGVGGEHLQGSAKGFYQAAAPTKRPDTTTNLDSADAGRMWIDSDDKIPYVFDGTAFQKLVAGQVGANAVELGDIQANAVNARNLNPDVVCTDKGLVQEEPSGCLKVCVKETIEIDSGCLRVKPGTIAEDDLLVGIGLTLGWAKIEDVKADTVVGGTFTSGAWQTRVLQTKVDPSTIVTTLAANQFTLAAGTYQIRWAAPAFDVGVHQTRLQNITDVSTETLGSCANSDTSQPNVTLSEGLDRFTIAAAKVFEIQHRCVTTKATTGFGVPGSFGVGEIYTQVEIRKEV